MLPASLEVKMDVGPVLVLFPSGSRNHASTLTVASVISSFKSWLDPYVRLKYQKKSCKSGLVGAVQKPEKCFITNSVTNTEL